MAAGMKGVSRLLVISPSFSKPTKDTCRKYIDDPIRKCFNHTSLPRSKSPEKFIMAQSVRDLLQEAGIGQGVLPEASGRKKVGQDELEGSLGPNARFLQWRGVGVLGFKVGSKCSNRPRLWRRGEGLA